MATQTLRIGIDSRQAVAGAEQVSRSLRDIQAQAARAVRSTESMEASFSKLKGAAAGLNGILATMGIGAGFTQMVTTMATFEQKMSGIKAVTQASADEMEQLEKAARRLGATTSFSATQAAEGMTFLGQAGFNTSQIIQSMEPILNLAAAGAMDLGKASEIASSIMGGFRLNASDMTNIADTLATAAAAGSLDLADLGNSMKYVGPVAASLGISLKDTAAAMVVLSNSGIKGEQAGTALRGILASLLDPTKAAEKDIATLGLTFDQLNPKTNSLSQIIDKLKASGIDAATAFKLFGQEGAPAISILTANSGALAKTATDLNKVEGAAKKMADTMSDNLAGDWKNLTGAVEELTLAIGESGMLGALRSVTQTATGLVRVWAGMGDTLGDQQQYFTNLANVVEALAVTIGTVYVGRALGGLITRSAAAVQSQLALAAATTATSRATAASSAIEAAAATSAVARAQANVAGAQAALQMAIAQDKGTGSMVAQRAAAAQLAAANATLTTAKASAVTAEVAHSTALAATTVRARAATAAMRLLSGAMAFFGGPIGLAITAIGAAIYYLQTRTTEAAKQQATFNERLDKMRSINADLITASGARRTELENERQQILKNADAEYALAEARLNGLKAFQASGQTTVVDKVDTGLKKLDQKLGFKGAGVNDAVAAVGQLPGVGLLGSATGMSVSDMQLETTDKQIKDTTASLATLREQREKLRAEGGKPVPALVPPTVGGGATGKPSGSGKDATAAGGKSDATTKDIDQRKKAFDALLERYSDEIAATDQQVTAYGKSAQEVDRLTAQYELWNAAREAGLNTDENVLANIADVSTQYARAKQEIRELRDAEKAKSEAMEESSRITAAAATPLEQYKAQMEKLRALMQQYIDTNGEVGISQETFARSVENLNASMNSEGQQIFDATRTSAEQYEIELEKLRRQLELYIETNGALGISQDTFNRALQQLKETVGSTTPELDHLANSIPNITVAFDQAASSSLMHFEDALVDIVTGSKSAREAFADMAKSIAADLARMAIRMAIIQPLAMMFGGGFGGMAGGMVATGAPMALGGIYHTGGIVGADPVPTRSFSALPKFHSGGVVGTDDARPAPFFGIPKFHTGGLASNETPAVLQKGEGVFTAAQMASLQPVNNNNTSAPVTINVSVQQTQGGDPAAAENQGRIIAKQVQMAMGDYISRAQRPGGQLNPNGGY